MQLLDYTASTKISHAIFSEINPCSTETIDYDHELVCCRRCGVQLGRLQFDPELRCVLHLRFKYSPRHTFLEHPQSTFFLNVKSQVPHAYKYRKGTLLALKYLKKHFFLMDYQFRFQRMIYAINHNLTLS